MCPPQSLSDQPSWHLEEGDGVWRLVVVVASAPELEIGDAVLRLRLSPESAAVTLSVPEHALPLDPSATRCTFSRKRGHLIVEWPRAEPLTTDASDSRTTPERNNTAPAEERDEKESDDKHQKTEDKQEENSEEKPVEQPAGRPDAVEEEEQKQEQKEDEEKLSGEEWRARGNAAVKAGNLEEAIVCYAAGLSAGGGDVALLYSNRALCLHRLGRSEEALEDAKQCVVHKPDFFKGYLRGAMALRSLGRPEEALAFLRRAPALGDGHDEAEKLAAELRPEAAAMERARIEALGGAERAKEEGNVLFRKGSFEAAIEQYNRALELCESPEDAMVLAVRNNRAACFHQLSDFGAVVKDTTFVLEREPGNLKALMRRMLALEPLERYEAALADARAVLQQDPRN